VAARDLETDVARIAGIIDAATDCRGRVAAKSAVTDLQCGGALKIASIQDAATGLLGRITTDGAVTDLQCGVSTFLAAGNDASAVAVWGGAEAGNYFNTGGRYCAQSGSPTPKI
jgi:hypothetical protein